LKLSAVDYLLKPIDPAEFVLAIKKVRLFLNSIRKSEEKPGVARLQLPTQQGLLFIEEQNIIQIDGMGSYCRIMTANPFENIVVSRNIGQFEQTLSDRFFRCHNSHIINLDYVTGFSSKSGLFAILKGNISVEVSRRQKEALLSRLSGR
ncbi:MAG: LytR/AlgR family response regulator transcription factor, partial [Flavitalea sp.]